MLWQVVLALRAPGVGKSRLVGATARPDRHADLVQAIQHDAVAAVVQARADSLSGESDDPGRPRIDRVWIVSGPDAASFDPTITVLADPGTGLNDAFDVAAVQARRATPTAGLLVLVADLPSLRAAEVLAVLAQAAEHDRGLVSDQSGEGTTMLTCGPGVALRASFGHGSARRHRELGHVELSAGPGARTDVDTAQDLQRCLRLGVGRHTAAMVSQLHPFT